MKIYYICIEKKHIHNLKRIYFVFYGYAVAYGINMLFAWQIGNLSIASSVQNSTVSLFSFLKTGEFTEYSEKNKAPAVRNASVEIQLYADIRSQSRLCKHTEIVQQNKHIHSVEDPGIWEGFDFIIKFPDKLS